MGIVAFGPETLKLAGRCFDEVVLHTYFTDETTARCVQTVKQAAEHGDEKLLAPWASVLQQSQNSGTQTGAEVAATMTQFSEQMQSAVRGQRRAALEAAQVFSENFTTLASGILIGLSEGLQGRETTGRKTKKPG